MASGEWILSLDADEVMTPALVAEIPRCRCAAGMPVDIDGFRLPRVPAHR